MSEAWHNFLLAINFVDHILPLLITLGGGTVFWAVKKYLPQLHYIKLVADAVDDKGVIALAKYMATKNGGPHINTEALWEDFIPAAKAIANRYKLKID